MAVHPASFHEQDAHAQEKPEVRRDVAYGEEEGQRLDVYLPAGDSDDRPAVLLIHGGGWGGGDKADYELLARRFVDEEGWVALAVNYRLDVPERWPTQVSDIQTAVQWTADNASDLGVDPDRLGLLGGSSGGHLAAMVGTVGTKNLEAGPDTGTARVRAVATWSAPLDLRDLQSFNGAPPEDCTDDDECRGLVVPGVVEEFIGCSPEGCPGEYDQASPVARVTADSTPMILVNARDELIDDEQARAMADALDSADVDNELVVLEGSGHALMYVNEAWEPTVGFLSDHLTDDPWYLSSSAKILGLAVIGLIAALTVALTMAAVRRRS